MLVSIFYPSSSYKFTSQVSLLVANSHRPVHQSHLSSPLRLIPIMDGCINRSHSAGRTRNMSWWLFDLFNLLLMCASYHLMFVTLVSDTAQANKFVTCFHLRCQYKIKRTTSIPNCSRWKKNHSNKFVGDIAAISVWRLLAWSQPYKYL